MLAAGEETEGKYAMFEAIVPPGGWPPLHIHSREEESFWVLEGRITFQLGEDRFVAEVGTFLNLPVGSLHSFKNESGERARLLISVAPPVWRKCFSKWGNHFPMMGKRHRRRRPWTSTSC
jgi:mannose-6-phosphate isomerase-like protein (cupin superfamily)